MLSVLLTCAVSARLKAGLPNNPNLVGAGKRMGCTQEEQVFSAERGRQFRNDMSLVYIASGTHRASGRLSVDI